MIGYFKRWFDRTTGRSAFTKAVATLLSGTVIAMVIAYAVQPILTRLYTPEAFGLFDTFVSLVALLLPFASFRYEDAMMLPEEDAEALGVLGLSILLVLVVAGLSFIFTLTAPHISGFSDNAGLASTLIWIPPTLVAVRFAKLTELWLNRKKQYAGISRGQVAQTSVMATSRIALSRMTPVSSPVGLLWGYIAGHITGAVYYGTKISRTQPHFTRHVFDWHNIKTAAQRFKQFPRFSMPSTLLTTLQSRLPFILLLFFFDETTVGFFGRAFALFAVPLSLIGNAISQVFFVEGAIARREGVLTNLAARVHSRLVIVGLFPTVALMITGPQVMEFVLGEPWKIAGEYLQWLAPWFFLASIASPLTRVFDILEQQRFDFLTSTVIFVVQTSLFVAGCLTGDIILTLIFLSAGGIAARVIHIGVMLRLAGSGMRAALTPYAQQTLVSMPFAVILYFVQSLGTPWLTTLALAVTGSGYLAIVYRQLVK